MVPPLEIVYHDVARSDALDVHIREQAGGLAESCHDLCSCRVTLEKPRHLGACQVRLEMLMVPGEELVAVRDPEGSATMVQVLDRLFDDAREQLFQASVRHADEARARRMELLTAL